MTNRSLLSPRTAGAIGVFATFVLLGACAGDSKSATKGQLTAAEANAFVEARLKVFDTLDFDVFSNQKWDRLKESHAADIIVTWPDGHDTKGLPQHIEDLKAMFVYAPDITIKEHPIRIGQGDFTAVRGIMTGTFTKPMPIGGGKTIPPTNKKFSLNMATIGHWTNGTMDHEWLYWDGADFMKQLGLAK